MLLLPTLPPSRGAHRCREQGAAPVTLNYANSLRVSGAAQPTSAGMVKLRGAELLQTTPRGRDQRRAPQRAGRAGRGSGARRWWRRGVSVAG